jgi:hypothetical protein
LRVLPASPGAAELHLVSDGEPEHGDHQTPAATPSKPWAKSVRSLLLAVEGQHVGPEGDRRMISAAVRNDEM